MVLEVHRLSSAQNRRLLSPCGLALSGGDAMGASVSEPVVHETSAPWIVAEVRFGGYVGAVSDQDLFDAAPCPKHNRGAHRYGLVVWHEGDEFPCGVCGAPQIERQLALGYGFYNDLNAAKARMHEMMEEATRG